jgi:hypothetical protein
MPKKRKRSKTAVGKIMLARLHQERAQLEETRNNLRAIAEDATELATNADEGMDQLMEAITTLSKYV